MCRWAPVLGRPPVCDGGDYEAIEQSGDLDVRRLGRVRYPTSYRLRCRGHLLEHVVLSTFAQFGAIGTNQLFFVASAVASLPLTAAAWSSRSVAVRQAPLAIRPFWEVLSR